MGQKSNPAKLRRDRNERGLQPATTGLPPRDFKRIPASPPRYLKLVVAGFSPRSFRGELRLLAEDADRLVAFAESIATVLSEKRDELGIRTDVEACLHASIAATTVAIDTYLELVAHSTKSSGAQRYLALAKARCNRSIEQLRRRVTRAIAHLCRLIDERELSKSGIRGEGGPPFSRR